MYFLYPNITQSAKREIVPLPLSKALPFFSDSSVPVHTDLTNRTIRANCSAVNLTVNDIVIIIDIDTPENFCADKLKRYVMLKGNADPDYFSDIFIVCKYTVLHYVIDSLISTNLRTEHPV